MNFAELGIIGLGVIGGECRASMKRNRSGCGNE
jgi:hypothetical protein